ncbi:MAG: hypothetical protein EXS18_08110 [Verrucomicrobiae bacterium]|nr:hypothetical protein [Verrucomicrobiae bacterium]
MEDGCARFSILHPLSSLLLLFLIGCQSPPAQKSEQTGPLNFSAYLYSLYDTEFATRPGESIKEDKLTLKPHAAVAVARLGEFAPREILLHQLRAQTNLFSRVAGIPAVIAAPGENPGPPQGKPSQTTVKDHILKMRQLASDTGADYLYLLGGVSNEFATQEMTGILDLTIIGYYIVGSNRIEVEQRGSAVLVDVATGRALSVVTVEGKKISRVPTGMLESGKKKAFERANAQLEEELTKRLMEQLENRQ